MLFKSVATREFGAVAEKLGNTTVYETCHETSYEVEKTGDAPVPDPANDQDNGGLNVGVHTTTHAYTFYSLGGSVTGPEVATETTFQPIVTSDEHGFNSANSSTDSYDSYGRVTWSKDAAGSISYTAYDSATGAVIKQIQDVNTNDRGDFTGLPGGWTNTAGKELVTTYLVDSQGRTIEETDPAGNVTWTVYHDAAQTVTYGGGTATILNQTRTYPGWHLDSASGHWMTSGPVQVSQEVVSATGVDYNESLSYGYTGMLPAGTVAGVNYAPVGTESLTGNSNLVVQSLSRSLSNSAGQVYRSLQYTSMPTSGYSLSTADFGQKGQNYLETDTFYDDLGRTISTHNPDGGAQATVYDAFGRVTQQWKGTSDVPNVDLNGDGAIDSRDFQYWLAHSATNVTAVNFDGMNMYLASSSQYDGDGNVTESDTYSGLNSSGSPIVVTSGVGGYTGTNVAYSTYYQYDWRDRQIGSVGPDGVATMSLQSDNSTESLDNLGEATETRTYAGASGSPGSISLGTPELRSDNISSYDSQGRVYESLSYQVNVDSVTLQGTRGDYLPTDTWYDSRGNVAATRTGGGPIQKSAYDGAGELVETYTCAVGTATSSLTYAQATTLQSTDTVVQQTQTWYDRDGRTIAAASYQRLPGSANTGALTATNAYATASATFYDAAGRDIEDVNYGHEQTGDSTHYFFDGSGNLILNGDGVPSAATGLPRARQTTLPNTYLVTATAYNDAAGTGPIVDQIDNAGVKTETRSDLAGRTIRTIQNFDGLAYGAPGSGFDSSGNVLAADTDKDVTTDYQYDYSGRLVTTTAYDAKGTGNGVTTEATKYLYTSTIDPSLQTAVVEPDSGDNVSPGSDGGWTITSGSDHKSTTYDLLGRALTSTDQRGVTHSYAYDTAGRRISDTVTDFGSIAAGAGRAVNEIDTSYTDLGQVYQVTSKGLVSGAETVLNQIQDAYDGWGNLIQQWQAVSGQVYTNSTPPTPSVQYGYESPLISAGGDAVATVRLNSITYPNGRKLDYNYAAGVDAIMSRLSNITTEGESTANAAYTYLGAGTIASADYQESHVKLDYSAGNFAAWDRFGRVQDQFWASYGANSFSDEYRYGYNAAGNRTYRENVPAHTASKGLDELYTYDNLNRLTNTQRGTLNLTDPNNPTISSTTYQTWSLDGLGNFNQFDNNSVVQNRTSNAANEIATINGGTATRGYDAAGNMTTTLNPADTSTALGCTYDAWNRLVSVTGGASTVTYSYDGTGRLVETAVSGGATTYSYYSGQNAVETRVNGTTASNVQYQYVYSPLANGKTPILRDDFTTGAANPRLYYLADANSNVTAVVGHSGGTWHVAERYVYDAYGAVTYYASDWSSHSTSPILAHANTVLFASMVLDLTTGLYYDEARWYSTATSTFITTDPALADSNLYRYCESNPALLIDPSGMAGAKYTAAEAQNLVSDTMKDHHGKAAFVVVTTKELGGPDPKQMAAPATRVDIATLGDLIRELKLVKQKNGIGVAVLEIHGHGAPGGLEFGSGTNNHRLNDPMATVINKTNAYNVGFQIKPYLACPAVLILYGCNTGNTKKTPDVLSDLADGSGANVIGTGGFGDTSRSFANGNAVTYKYLPHFVKDGVVHEHETLWQWDPAEKDVAYDSEDNTFYVRPGIKY